MSPPTPDKEANPGPSPPTEEAFKPTLRFWLVVLSLCVIGFLTALDGTVLAIALPRIASDLALEDKYIWVVNSFWVAQTVFQPLVAQLSDLFGRRTPLLVSVAVFAVGSALAGASSSAAMLIAGRTVQGVGSSGIMLLMEVIICDIVPLRERGKYMSITLSWCAAGAIVGPPVGGAIAERNWRWVFYMCLPISGVVLVLLFFCLKVRHTQASTWMEAAAGIDWVGNLIFVGSLTSFLLGLIFGGTVHPWDSWHVVLPLTVGVVGWGVFHAFERSKYCRNPVVPAHVFGNRTAVAGFAITFISSMLTTWLAFQWPLYWQGVLGASPLKAGINYLVFEAFFIPSAAVAGQLLARLGVYRPIHFTGFLLLVLAPGLNFLLSAHTKTAVWAVFVALNAIGLGLLVPTVLPAILSSLQESDVAVASGMYSFLRSFGFIWGATIPGIIFNTSFDRWAGSIQDSSVRGKMMHGHAYQFASGPYIPSLPAKTKLEVVYVFLKSLQVGWEVSIAFACVGLLVVFVQKHYNLRTNLDTKYGLEEEEEETPKDASSVKVDEIRPH